jgi:hypothetical protein
MMAIEFVHYPTTNLAIHTWSEDFSLDALLRASRAYLLAPARFEILDIRRLNLDAIGAQDLFELAEHLRRAYHSDRHVPGQTAIVRPADGALVSSRSQRLLHNFSIWAKELQLPRDFALFSTMADAVAWLGSHTIETAQAAFSNSDSAPEDREKALRA